MFKKVNGDILIPETRGRKVIVCHQVNCKGVMGAGLAKQIRDTCPGVFDSYRCEVMRITAARYSSGNPSVGLGNVLFCPVKEKGFTVANLFAQDGYGRDRQYTDYDALRKCLNLVHRYAATSKADVIRIPYKMGCGLAGGDWGVVLGIMKDTLTGPYEVQIFERG